MNGGWVILGLVAKWASRPNRLCGLRSANQIRLKKSLRLVQDQSSKPKPYIFFVCLGLPN